MTYAIPSQLFRECSQSLSSLKICQKERGLLGRSSASVKRMTELISNLLEIPNLRLGSGMTINKATIYLSKQGDKIVQELQFGYPQADLIVEFPGPMQEDWEVVRLDRLMTNLITNAVRHGRPGGPVNTW